MKTKKKPLHALRVTLSDMRSNSGAPSAPAPLDWVVSHQTPFPWLNTVTFMPAAPLARVDEGK